MSTVSTASMNEIRDTSPALAPTATRRIAITLGIVTFVAMIPVTMLVAPLKELILIRYQTGAFWTHSFMSINMIGAVALSPLIAVLADRNGARKRIAALALAVDGVCLAAMTFMPSLGTILAVRFIEGAAHILAISSLMAVAAGWAGANGRGRMMGVVGACMMFGTACGTRLGGFAWEHCPGQVFILAGAFSLAAAFGVLLFVSEPGHISEKRPGGWRVLRSLRQQPRLVAPLAYAFIDRLCIGVVITTFVLFLSDAYGMTPSERSKLLLLFLVPFAALVYPAGRLIDRIGRVWPIVLGSITFGVVFASYGFVPRESLWIVMILSGIASAIMFAPNLALCADLAPADQRGAAYSAFNTAGALGFIAGPLLGAAFFTLFSSMGTERTAYTYTFLATGMAEVLCALLTLPALLRLKRAGQVR